jgi:hypothetical protein
MPVYYQRLCVLCRPWLRRVLKLKNKIAGLFLLSLSCGVSALSLGELRGAAWVGQALDLRVTVQLDEPVNSDLSCFEAEVIYGEFPQPPGRVRVSLEPSSQAASTTLRIQSSNPVNEPVVTVNLKAGCAAKTARRYVLLADVPVSTMAHTGGAVSTANVASSPMATSISPTYGRSNSPMEGRPDYDKSAVMAIRAAASLSR